MSSFFIKAIKPFRWHIIGLLSINVIWAIDASLRPFIIKIILDKITIIHEQQSGSILQILSKPVLIYILVFTLIAVLMRFYDRLWMIITPNLKKQIGLKMIDSLMEHSHNMYQNNFSGNLANKVNDITVGVCHVLKTCIDQFFSQFMALFIGIYTVWQVHPKFSIGLILWVMIFLGVSCRLSAKAKYLSSMAAEAKSQVFGNIVDILINMINVRLFNSKHLEKNLLDQNMTASVKAEQNRDWFFLKIYAFQGGSFILLQTVCLWWLISGLQIQTVTIGDFTLILTINSYLLDYLLNISRELREYSENIGNISQAMLIIETKNDLEDHYAAKELIVPKGRIVFENVSFNYTDKTNLFENQYITIEPGQKVGLVGYSGSGKSTFVNLILRLFDVTSGKILIDNQNIKYVTQTSLRKSIAMIPQDPSLFHRNIIENIRYGNFEASELELINAAKLANAHDFITALPNGYDSLVGEKGIKLSGGQRQKIAIARAILKNAPILILDEATSQLDSITEKQIQDSLFELIKNKTTIIIAHRLSTLLNMDRILVFDKGRIIQDGTHQTLLMEGGLYKELWDAQVRDFLPKVRETEIREFGIIQDHNKVIENFAKAI